MGSDDKAKNAADKGLGKARRARQRPATTPS